MKNILFSIIAMTALSLTACGGNTVGNTAVLTTDSITYTDSSRTAMATITADFPKAADKTVLNNIICEYINEELGGTYLGTFDDSKALLAHYTKAYKDTLDNIASADERPDAPQLYSMKSVRKTFETDKFVTYISCSESYYGGAHGMHTAIATTFRKTDGRRFGAEMLINTGSDAFRMLIKEGLRLYFEQDNGAPMTDEELKNALLTDYSVDFLPLPQFGPALYKDGVVFTYQPYEIAPYAAGMPSFTVPYDKIKPYLTAAVIKML